MSVILKIQFLLHYIECITEMDSAATSDTEISEATHKNLIKDGYHSSNKVNYILQMLWWEMSHVPISYQSDSQYSTACQYVRSPLSEGRYMQKASVGGFSDIWQIII